MAGHSKWANIRHRKARQDARRGRAWSKCSRAIIVAAKNGGGDPAANLTLRYAIDEARAENMPKDTIDNAVKKGCGELEGVSYESVIYEGYGPCGVAMMLDILTDNRNRTSSDIRFIFDRHNGSLGAAGCVSYLFTPKGQMFVAKADTDEESLMAVALEAGAEDIADDGDDWQILCELSDYITVRENLDAADVKYHGAAMIMSPATTVAVAGKDVEKIINLIEALEDNDDVQKVHSNVEIPDEELAKIES